MELHAVAGQLFIVDGIEQEQTPVPGLLAQRASGRAAHKRQQDVLFVHLTLSGSLTDTANLMQGLLQGISQQFFKSNGSATAALRQVIHETNNRLLQLNLSGKNAPREGAITCAVLRKNELYVVQTGESLALLGHNFGVERIPAHTPEHMTPLGRSTGLDFRYYHQHLQPGDMLLLADPRISHLPSHSLSPALVDTELELGLDELRETIGPDSGRLLLVEFTDDAPDTLPVAARPIIRKGRITLPKGSTQAATAAALPAQPIREGQLPPVSSTTDFNEGRDISEAVEVTARQAASRSALGLSFLTGWIADLMLRLNPSLDEGDEEGSHFVLPVILAITIPLIVAIVVSGVYLQRGRVRQVAELRQEMSQSLVLAQEAGNDNILARQHYSHLVEIAAAAEELRPGDPGVAEMRRQAIVALDELDGVTRLSAAPFYTFDSSTDLSAVALRGDFTGGIYTLDSGNGIVYAHVTDETFTNLLSAEPTTIGFAGQAVGNHVIQEIVDFIWRPSGVQVEQDGLAMLDKGGALVSYYPNSAETRAITLGLSSEWQSPVAFTQFLERLYILDPASAAIWKYFPQEEGFIVDPAERQLTMNAADIDLNNAIDIDIYSEDGSLLVAYVDGRIRYYDTRSGRIQWDESDLLENGLATPIGQPAAAKLVGKGLNASIFVLDSENGRIIQISRLGSILAQYRAIDDRGQDVFVGGSDLAITESPLRIFVTAGNKLYLANQ
jgi:hypothetical protein